MATALDRLSARVLRVRESILSRVATHAARAHATLGSDVRFGACGRLVNLHGAASAVSIGESSVIDGELLTFAHGGRIQIGSFCYVGRGTHVWSATSVSIGDRVLLSHSVEIHDTNAHPLDAVARAEQMRAILSTGHPRHIDSIRSAPVRIEDDVWIGFGAAVLKGVTIGRGAIIGARAVVRADVPPGTVVYARADTASGDVR